MTLSQNRAATWFRELQRTLIETIEAVEKDYCAQQQLPFQGFQESSWQRRADDAQAVAASRFDPEKQGGGGVAALLDGRLFEKAGINFSEVYGTLHPDFAKAIPGAAENPFFWASGVSLVIHPRSPFVPTVHMNTRWVS